MKHSAFIIIGLVFLCIIFLFYGIWIWNRFIIAIGLLFIMAALAIMYIRIEKENNRKMRSWKDLDNDNKEEKE